MGKSPDQKGLTGTSSPAVKWVVAAEGKLGFPALIPCSISLEKQMTEPRICVHWERLLHVYMWAGPFYSTLMGLYRIYILNTSHLPEPTCYIVRVFLALQL